MGRTTQFFLRTSDGSRDLAHFACHCIPSLLVGTMNSVVEIQTITSSGGVSPALRGAAVALLLVLTSCTYTKDDAVVLPDRFEQPGTLAFADDSLAADQWVVANTDDGLNLRSEPTANSEKLARLAAGETLASTGHVTDVEGVRWIEVRWGNNIGWVHSAYLAPVGDPVEAFETSDLEASDNSTEEVDTSENSTENRLAASGIAGRTLVVTGVSTGLNLLDAPGGSRIIETLDALSEVTETGEKQSPWVQVANGDSVGWVHSDFVIPLTDGDLDAPSEDNSGTKGTAYVYAGDSDGLNLRSAPNGTIIDRLISGTIVIRTGSVSGNWSEITHDNRTGWVSDRYLVEVVGDITDRDASIAEDVQVTSTPGAVGVNIRDVPNGEILVGMPAGDWGILTGNKSGLWAELSYNGVLGWAFIDLLVPVEGFEDLD